MRDASGGVTEYQRARASVSTAQGEYAVLNAEESSGTYFRPYGAYGLKSEEERQQEAAGLNPVAARRPTSRTRVVDLMEEYEHERVDEAEALLDEADRLAEQARLRDTNQDDDHDP